MSTQFQYDYMGRQYKVYRVKVIGTSKIRRVKGINIDTVAKFLDVSIEDIEIIDISNYIKK